MLSGFVPLFLDRINRSDDRDQRRALDWNGQIYWKIQANCPQCISEISGYLIECRSNGGSPQRSADDVMTRRFSL